MLAYQNTHGVGKWYVAINPRFKNLIIALPAAVEKGDDTLDREAS
jgi:hypothetical protein